MQVSAFTVIIYKLNKNDGYIIELTQAQAYVCGRKKGTLTNRLQERENAPIDECHTETLNNRIRSMKMSFYLNQ